MKYSITSQEFGRGTKTVRRFSTLDAAAQYIADRWQGDEYRDGPCSFHTDYCTYLCRGFRLDQVTSREVPEHPAGPHGVYCRGVMEDSQSAAVLSQIEDDHLAYLAAKAEHAMENRAPGY